MNRRALALSLGFGVVAAWWLRSRRAASGVEVAAPSALDSIAQNAQSAFDELVAAVIPRAWTPPAAAGPYLDAIYRAEQENDIPHNQLARQLDIESDHFAADVVSGARTSRTGAIGIAQFMPATAADLRVDPRDPFASIAAAGRYMAQLFAMTGSWSAALAAYNWGVGNVKRKGLEAAPKETREYVVAITATTGVA